MVSWARTFVLALVWTGAAAALPTAAGDVIAQGIAALAEGRYDVAVARFEEAGRLDPRNGEITYLSGVAHNRLGRPAEALDRLDRAEQSGYRASSILLERGTAYAGLGRHRDAVAALTKYEALEPRQGRTSLELGKAYRGLRDTAKAEAHLVEAVRRDPGLYDETDAVLARMGLAMPGHVLDLDQVPAGGPPSAESPRSRILRTTAVVPGGARATIGAGRKSETRGSLALGGGFNDNVIAINDAFAGAEISNASSEFIQTIADLNHTTHPSDKSSLQFGYYFQANTYQRLSAFDLDDHTAYISYRKQLQEDRQFTLALSDEFTNIGGNDFRNQFAVRPAYSWKCGDKHRVELSYYYANFGFSGAEDPFLNRDGESHTVGITDRFHVGHSQLTGQVGYYHLNNAAVGSDFDFDSDGVTLFLHQPIGRKGTAAQIFYGHSWDDYDNLNSLAAFAVARRDEIDRLSTQISGPVSGKIYGYLRHEYTKVDSNVLVFDFDQNVYTGGFYVRY